MKAWLKRNYYRLLFYSKGVKIGKNALLNVNVYFEGRNVIARDCEIASSRIGLATYISAGCTVKHTLVGRFCSIGRNLQTGLGSHPSKVYVSTHPAFFSVQKQAGFSFTDRETFQEHVFADADGKYIITIGNDVWIGNNVMIMDGIKIGNGAIVAAGAVVTKDVLPYAIVGGVPARQIRFRFTDEQIAKLQAVEWWNWDLETLQKNSHLFNNIEQFMAAI